MIGRKMPLPDIWPSAISPFNGRLLDSAIWNAGTMKPRRGVSLLYAGTKTLWPHGGMIGTVITGYFFGRAMNLDHVHGLIERLRKDVIGAPKWMKSKQAFECKNRTIEVVVLFKLIRAAPRLGGTRCFVPRRPFRRFRRRYATPASGD